MSRIVIGDVHGCYKTLLALMAKLPKNVPVTFVGDLIDRGPDSASVIEYVKSNGHDCVLGNHEQMMLDAAQIKTSKVSGKEYVTASNYSDWMMNGGHECLYSYIDSTGEVNVELFKSHYEWLKTLPLYKMYPELNMDWLLVSHTTPAYVWGHEEDREFFKNGILWDRYENPKKINGLYSVYGHTPQQNGPTVKEHFACIDTGAVFKRATYGKLTALMWPEMQIFEQENIDA